MHFRLIVVRCVLATTSLALVVPLLPVYFSPLSVATFARAGHCPAHRSIAFKHWALLLADLALVAGVCRLLAAKLLRHNYGRLGLSDVMLSA